MSCLLPFSREPKSRPRNGHSERAGASQRPGAAGTRLHSQAAGTSRDTAPLRAPQSHVDKPLSKQGPKRACPDSQSPALTQVLVFVTPVGLGWMGRLREGRVRAEPSPVRPWPETDGRVQVGMRAVSSIGGNLAAPWKGPKASARLIPSHITVWSSTKSL